MDDLSSAHVYLRQKPGEKLDDISPDLLLECASLVKVGGWLGGWMGLRVKEVFIVLLFSRWVGGWWACVSSPHSPHLLFNNHQANSIEGCKLKEVSVVYTRWRNLKKTKAMEVGQIGFHDNSKVRARKGGTRGEKAVSAVCAPLFASLHTPTPTYTHPLPLRHVLRASLTHTHTSTPTTGPAHQGGEMQLHRQCPQQDQGSTYVGSGGRV